jgi:DNA polymerase-3 subunit epsilon
MQNDVEFLKKKDAKFTKYSKKIIQPTSEEIQLHKNFLKNELKKNFFN